jgi:hypothetical protein
MFIRRTVIAAALIAVPLSFAAPAQATCGYFGADESKPESQGICGVPDLEGTFGQVRTNLTTNFKPGTAAGHLRDNFNPGTAGENFKHNLTNGVGSEDSAE